MSHSKTLPKKRWYDTIVFFTFALLSLSIALQPAPALAQGSLTFDVQAGFDGYYKMNGWLPIRVIVNNDGPDIDGEVQFQRQGTGNSDIIYSQSAVLPTHSRKQFTLYTFIQNYTQELTVRLVQQDKVLAEKKVSIEPLKDQDFLYAVVSDDMAALHYLSGLPPLGTGRVHVAHLTLSDIPPQGRVLGSIDALIMHQVDSAQMTDAQREALRGWVAFGGHLILCGGPNAVPTAAGLGDLNPVQVNGTQTISDLDPLADYVGEPLAAGPVVVAQVTVRDDNPQIPTQVLVESGDLPLLVRSEVDRGRVDYLAFDPNLDPMRTWQGNNALWPKLLFSTPLAMRPGKAQISWSSPSNALANIPGLHIPSIWLVSAFLFIYILTVGPLNFLVLKLVDRHALAWISVPVLILLFSCAAYIIGFASRGRKVVISEIAVVRAQPASQSAAIDTFFSLYSPAKRSYDVRLSDNLLVQQLTRSSFGGGAGSDRVLHVEQGAPTYLRDLEINVGAMRGAATHSLQAWSGLQTSLTMDKTAPDTYHVEGTITNQSGVDIENAVLTLHLSPVQIGSLPAGETKTISVDFTASTSFSSYYNVIDELIGPPSLGNKEQERERKRALLNNILAIYGYNPSLPLDGLNLLGWLSTSPNQIEVDGTTTTRFHTTLLIATLPTTSKTEGQVLVPKGFMNWKVKDGEPDITPYEIYSFNDIPTFTFWIPDGTNVRVEHLYLHVDSLDSTPYGSTPVIYIRNVESDKWTSFMQLQWGENELENPAQLVAPDGSIEVRVSTSTIDSPISVDFSMQGTRIK